MAAILIVEDDNELREIYQRTLQRAGHDIALAANGAQAYVYLEENSPDLMVLDILMPTMSGDMLLERIQDMPARRTMKIVIASAYPGFRQRATELGAHAFLLKPITPHDLIRTIEEVLNA